VISKSASVIGLLLIASVGFALAQDRPTKEARQAYGTDLSGFNQYYLHGVRSDADAFPKSFVRQTGGDPDHRLAWDSDNGYLNARSDPEQSKKTFQREAQRLADRIETDYARDGRRVLLHGHSAGGVLAAQVVQELERRGVPVAGMATYGTPQKRLRFHDVQVPTSIPVREFRNTGDLVLDVDGTSRSEASNVVVINTGDNGNFEGHTFDQNYSYSPDVHAGLRDLAASQPDYMPGNSTRWEEEERGRATIDQWLREAHAESRWSDGSSAEADDVVLDHRSVSEVMNLVEMQEGDAAGINAMSEGADAEESSFAEEFDSRSANALSAAEGRIDEVDDRLQAIRDRQYLDDLMTDLLGSLGLDGGSQAAGAPSDDHEATSDHCAGGVFQCPNGYPWPDCKHEEKHDCPPPEYADPGPYLPNGPIESGNPGMYRPQSQRQKPDSP
jgi:hypothetical protein